MNDLISRKEAIDILYNYKRMLFDGVSDPVIYGVQGAIEVIKTIPCAVSTGEWIPCSERLPCEGEECLITDAHGDIRHCIKDKSGTSEFATYEEYMHIDDVIAWMPLPQSYREEE